MNEKKLENASMNTDAMQKMMEIANRLFEGSPTIFKAKDSFLLDHLKRQKKIAGTDRLEAAEVKPQENYVKSAHELEKDYEKLC